MGEGMLGIRRIRGIRVGMQGIRVEMGRIRMGMQGIRVGMQGIEWNGNRKKTKKKVYKIQFSFFPEIEKNEIRIVIKR